MREYVLDLGEISKTQVELAGGKGAQLGELTRIDGIQVPPGFCVTTDAFRQILPAVPGIDDRLERLSAWIRATGRRSPGSARRSARPWRSSPSRLTWSRRSPGR